MSNRSAAVCVDARVDDAGDGLPFISPRQGPESGCKNLRVVGRGTAVSISKWAEVSPFLQR